MKTKVFLLLCLLAYFLVGTASAQLGRDGIELDQTEYISLWYPCMDEPIYGEIHKHFTVITDVPGDITATWRTFRWKMTGTLTGAFTGDHYTFEYVAHDHTNVNRKTGNWSFVGTTTIEKDGKSVYTLHITIHGQFNTPNGYKDLPSNIFMECN